MTKVQQAATALIEKHGGIRAASRATGIDAAYLVNLRSGAKVNPGDETLAKLGLEKSVTYRRKHPQAGSK